MKGLDFELAKGITVAEYQSFKKKNNQLKIAELIHQRFSSRYLEPVKNFRRGKKSGFCMMAITCLMIETLESFYQNWPDTKGKSGEAFFLTEIPNLSCVVPWIPFIKMSGVESCIRRKQPGVGEFDVMAHLLRTERSTPTNLSRNLSGFWTPIVMN